MSTKPEGVKEIKFVKDEFSGGFGSFWITEKGYVESLELYNLISLNLIDTREYWMDKETHRKIVEMIDFRYDYEYALSELSKRSIDFKLKDLHGEIKRKDYEGWIETPEEKKSIEISKKKGHIGKSNKIISTT